MTVRKLLMGLGTAAVLMIAAPVTVASGEVIIAGPSFFMHYNASDPAFRRDYLLIRRGFRPYLGYGDERHFSRRQFGYYQDHRIRRFRPYGARSSPGYRSCPSVEFYYRY